MDATISTSAEVAATADDAARAAYVCRNCGATERGAYCSACGQRKPERITVRNVLDHARGGLLTLDVPVLRTFARLTINPGGTARDYLEGKRQRYTNPGRYLFFAATFVTLLLLPVVARAYAENPALVQSSAAIYGKWAYLAYVVLIPVALLQRFFFRREGLNLAECYAFLMFAVGHVMWMRVAVLALRGLAEVPVPYPLLGALQAAYVTWAVAGLYRSWSAETLVKGFSLYGLYLALTWGVLRLGPELMSRG